MGSQHTVKTKCRFCRRDFDSFGLKKVCNDCERNMDEQFALIRAYIYENPDANMQEICDKLSMPSALIKYFLREERLSIRESSGKNLFLRCDSCGIPVSSGKYCKECDIKMARAETTATAHSIQAEEEIDRGVQSFNLMKLRKSTLRSRTTNLPRSVNESIPPQNK